MQDYRVEGLAEAKKKTRPIHELGVVRYVGREKERKREKRGQERTEKRPEKTYDRVPGTLPMCPPSF